MITSGRQIVGLSSGYIRPYSHTRNRKQVIVVVNESWGIFVFNHKLRLMWTRSIEADFALRYLAEVAILIDPHPMRRGTSASGNDTGVIIVGGRLGLKSDLGKNVHLHGIHQDTNGAGGAGPQPLEFPADYAEALSGRILKPGHKKGYVTSEDMKDTGGHSSTESLGTDSLHFDHAQHFSYYAFEGLRGASRWRHDSSSFVDETHANLILRPQHSSRHSGEEDWRTFRKSILETALPHLWKGGNRQSSTLEIAHVEKTRLGHQRQSIKKKRVVKSNFFVADTLNLRPHKDSEHVLKPNAIVAHLRDGLEILHLYSGRPLCRLTLKPGEVHVDLNGDGTIDHVEVLGGTHATGAQARTRNRAQGEHQHGNQEQQQSKCIAMVQSGIPPVRQLFNASICSTSWSDVMRFGAFGLMNTPGGGVGPGSGDLAYHSGGRSSHTGFSLEGSIGSTDGSATTLDDETSIFFNSAMREEARKQQGIKAAHPIVIQEPRTKGKSQFLLTKLDCAAL